MFGNDPLEMESLISSERGKDYFFRYFHDFSGNASKKSSKKT